MRVGILTTNYGSHPPDKWAEQTAYAISDLIVIPPDGPTDSDAVKSNRAKYRKAQPRLELDLADALEENHAAVQKSEADKVSADAKNLQAPLVPLDKHVADTMAKVNSVLSKSVFAEDFAHPDVQSHIKVIVAQHFSAVMDIERSWYVTKNPKNPQSQAYLAKKVGV